MLQTTSSLLALPAEIRNAIYTHALQDELLQCVHDMPHACSLDHHRRGQAFRIPSWMYACRQFRHEAGSLWLSEATFNYHAIDHVTRWLQSIAPGHQGMIRTVRKWVPMHQRESAERLLISGHKVFEMAGLAMKKDVLLVGYFDDTETASREGGGVSWIRGVDEVVAEKTEQRASVVVAEAEYLFHQ